MQRYGSRLATCVLLAVAVLALSACDAAEEGDVPKPPAPFAEAEMRLGEWTFVPVEGTACRGGTPTGLGVRLQENPDGLVVYFASGRFCLGGRCSAAADFDAEALERRFGGPPRGLFDSERAENPVANYDFVFVPNCTNDLHGGSRRDVPVVVDSTRRQAQFVGHRNVERFADVLVPYFSERSRDVLVYGVSAGSFGAAFNYPTVAQAFDPQPVDLVVESGPLLANEGVLAPAFQQTWRDVWNLDAALPPRVACPDCYGPEGGGLWNLYTYFARTYPRATFGLVTSEEDGTIRRFYNAGQPACAPGNRDACTDASEYRRAVYELRDALPTDRWATYVIPGGGHAYAINDESYYDVRVSGTPLTAWVAAVVGGDAPHVSEE